MWSVPLYGTIETGFLRYGFSTMNDSEPLSSHSETMQFVQRKDSTAAVADSLPTGTSFGHYVIKKYIGGGGMGRVYLAADAALDRDVAIKVLTQQRACDPSIVARFMNEAKSAARLNHEHIAQVYIAGEEAGIPYIAFEFVEGTNVRTMVEEHDVFPLSQALNYLLQIAHALDHAAVHGVIHRDVKPSNILITHEGRAKLIDMGLARLQDTAEARGDLTASGVTLGTFDYISPEQARDPRNADIRSDIYSLGCTFFFMLVGRPPFPEGTVLQKLLQHQGDAPPDIRSFLPSIPAEIAFLIQKMMAKDPKQRFQTPAVLIEALTDAARRLGLRPAGQGNLIWTPVQANQTSVLLKHVPWLTAVSLLLAGTFLMTLFSGPSGPFGPPDWIHDTVGPPAVQPPNSNNITKPVTDSYDVQFVSLTAAEPSPHSFRLGALVTGGSLQLALKGAGWTNHVSGGLSVADLDSATLYTAAQRVDPLSNKRCIDPTGNTPSAYSSLASALIDAEDGTVIELKWNNINLVAEPIRFDQRNFRFVPAAGYAPILLFEPITLQKSFFAVFSSNLTFEDVGIEVRLDSNVMFEQWSLFELSGNTTLTFKQCCLTVRNRSIFDDSASHGDVFFFHNVIPTDSEGTNDEENRIFEPLTIEIKDSLLRGEAVAIQNSVPQDIRVECTNSLIALAQPFIQTEERRRALRSATITIQWNRVAFFGHQGIARLSKEATTEPMVVDFESKQSVFVLNSSPFAVFRGLQSQEKALAEFHWSGEENYFQGVSGLRFQSSPTSPDAGMSKMTLEEWRQNWSDSTKGQTKLDALMLNEITKSMSRYVPSDLRAAFGLTEDSIPRPNLSWFPTGWNSD